MKDEVKLRLLRMLSRNDVTALLELWAAPVILIGAFWVLFAMIFAAHMFGWI